MRTEHLLSTILAAACIAPATAQHPAHPRPAPRGRTGDPPNRRTPPAGPSATRRPPSRWATWVKGEPVTSFADGQVYVMEFWAAGAAPCIRGIHLTELQKNYKDKGVTIVGTAIWQREPTQEDRVATVTASWISRVTRWTTPSRSTTSDR